MSETVEGTIKTLVEMGFDEAKAKKALTRTGWKGVEAAMEWLLAHGDDVGGDEAEDVEEVAAAAAEPPKELTEEEKKEQKEKLENLRIQRR